MKHSKALRLSLVSLSLLYLMLPPVIFFAGWLKPCWAMAAVIPVLFCGWQLNHRWPVESPKVPVRELLFAGAFCFGLTAFAGIGGLAPQKLDWSKHNAMLFDCVNLPWPVVLADGAARWPLVYYLAYYLPAAVAGKLAGYAVARAGLWLWSSLGLLLACLWFARLTGLPPRIAAPAFFAFSGLAFVGNLVVQLLGLADNYYGRAGFFPEEYWARIWEFPSHFWMLEWAPGQALAGWLSAALFLASPKVARPLCFVLLFTCDLLWSPFAGVGMGLLAFFLVWREGMEWSAKSNASLPAMLLPFGVLVAFYAAKISPEVAARFPRIPVNWFTQFHDGPSPRESLALLLLFIVFEFGILWWFIRSTFGKGSDERIRVDACGLALICLLPVTVGYYGDLALRGCVAPWFGLAVLTARTLVSGRLAPNLRRWFWLVVLLGAVTPLVEFVEQGHQLLVRPYDPSLVPHQVPAVVHISGDGFKFFGAQYVGSTNSIFWQNLAR